MIQHCTGELPQGAYGAAVTTCVEDEAGRFWVSNQDMYGNLEYASQVNFCPFCGVKAPTPATQLWNQSPAGAPLDAQSLLGWLDA
jgi:hypothetical protein